MPLLQPQSFKKAPSYLLTVLLFFFPSYPLGQKTFSPSLHIAAQAYIVYNSFILVFLFHLPHLHWQTAAFLAEATQKPRPVQGQNMYGQLSNTVHYQTRESSTCTVQPFQRKQWFFLKTVLDVKSENWSTSYKNMSTLPSSKYIFKIIPCLTSGYGNDTNQSLSHLVQGKIHIPVFFPYFSII